MRPYAFIEGQCSEKIILSYLCDVKYCPRTILSYLRDVKYYPRIILSYLLNVEYCPRITLVQFIYSEQLAPGTSVCFMHKYIYMCTIRNGIYK